MMEEFELGEIIMDLDCEMSKVTKRLSKFSQKLFLMSCLKDDIDCDLVPDDEFDWDGLIKFCGEEA